MNVQDIKRIQNSRNRVLQMRLRRPPHKKQKVINPFKVNLKQKMFTLAITGAVVGSMTVWGLVDAFVANADMSNTDLENNTNNVGAVEQQVDYPILSDRYFTGVTDPITGEPVPVGETLNQEWETETPEIVEEAVLPAEEMDEYFQNLISLDPRDNTNGYPYELKYEYSFNANDPTSKKKMEPSSCLTGIGTGQRAIQEHENTYTDALGFQRNGMGSENDDYVVALGPAFSPVCGERFLITFDTGIQINVLIGDAKAREHTDPTGLYGGYSSKGIGQADHVLEFVMDYSVFPENYQNLGIFEFVAAKDNRYDFLNGNIVSMQRLNPLEFDRTKTK